MSRKLKEHLNIYVYIYFPLLVSILFYLISLHTNENLIFSNNLKIYSVEISLSILGILLTILGLFAALPENKYEGAMKKYNYYNIIFNTLFFGILAAVVHLVATLIGICVSLQVYLFLIYISETIIATVWIYKILKLVYRT
ncbi:hypothetical protein C8U37_107108 [Trichococcus patagoniensis]|uniref:Uncharacterized protein n=1 Tax=Trichococcus patagoniensis TaxID=382641 RepID=A0A2T5ILS5_9LACT|nr:hypothetical protein [Trichococcus patagoniensis]PTQ84740.1 hypothetical protein C8U37_107108 [Trichococcus patagoniensis]